MSWNNKEEIILSIFINLYMFQAIVCPSSGETSAYATLRIVYGWQSGTPPSIPDSHQHGITSTKCRISTVVSPDDGHIVAQNT
jgi:hypothetical protein